MLSWWCLELKLDVWIDEAFAHLEVTNAGSVIPADSIGTNDNDAKCMP